MLDLPQKIFKNFGLNKTVLNNTVSLTLLQATNYLLPLIALPYLARILGPEFFGIVMYAQVFNRYFYITTEYGFDYTGTRQISISRDDSIKLNNIFWSIIYTKIIICLFCFLVLLILVYLTNIVSNYELVFIFSFGITIANVFFPTFFFQGIEKMKYITYANFFSKLISVILIFCFIKNQVDFIKVPIFYTLGATVSSLFVFIYAIRKFNLSIKAPKLKDILFQIRNGFSVFFSNISITLYTITNTIVLGYFANSTVIGIYVGIEKIILALKVIINPFYQASYPFLVNTYKNNSKKFWDIIEKYIVYTIIIMTLFCFICNIFSLEIINLILGEDFISGKALFHLFSFLILINPLSYIIFNNCLLVLNKDKVFSNIYILMGITNIVFLILFINTFYEKMLAAGLANVITQIFGLFVGYYYMLKYKRLKNEK